jgi:hypothetical protein
LQCVHARTSRRQLSVRVRWSDREICHEKINKEINWEEGDNKYSKNG